MAVHGMAGVVGLNVGDILDRVLDARASMAHAAVHKVIDAGRSECGDCCVSLTHHQWTGILSPMFRPEFLLLLTSVALNSVGSLLIKKGANAIVEQESVRSFQGLINHMLPAVNVFTISGLALLGISFVLFVLVLSKLPLSIAQPMLAMTYIFVAIGAYFVFGEAITASKIAGVMVIVLGVYLVSLGV